MTRPRRLVMLAVASAAALARALVRTARAQPTETEVKAAFLPRFARYVTWPAGRGPAPAQPFQLCVIGRDPFGRVLDRAAAGEPIDGHGVAVRRVAAAEAPTAATSPSSRAQTPPDRRGCCRAAHASRS